MGNNAAKFIPKGGNSPTFGKLGQPGISASDDQVVKYFEESEIFKLSGCIDVQKLQGSLGIDPKVYVAYQMALSEKVGDEKIKQLDTYHDFKKAARNVSIPDYQKRNFLIKWFDLQPTACSTKYAVGLKMAQQILDDQNLGKRSSSKFKKQLMEESDGLDKIRKERASSRYIEYEFLNERGIDEVNMIIAAAEAAFGEGALIEQRPMMAHVAGLLLLYMTPGEVYCVIIELLRSSKEKMESEEIKSMIRWHVPLNTDDQMRLYQAFGTSYLMTTLRKKRSLATHMSQIGFELKNYSSAAFDTIGARFLPLYLATDVILMYLVEGVKIIFRYAYAVLKTHKDFIKKTCTDPQLLLEQLSAEARLYSQPELLHKRAQSYPLKRGRYDLLNSVAEELFEPSLINNVKERRMTQEIKEDMSTCLTYDEMGELWEKLPESLQIKPPMLLYRASADGFNLGPSYFEKIKSFEGENRSSIVLILTQDQETYGMYLDDLVRLRMKDYSGQFENFLFSSIRSTFHVYKPTSINPRDFKNDEKPFEIGPNANTRPNSKDLAPAVAMCPKIAIQRKNKSTDQDASNNNLNTKRQTQPMQGNFGGGSFSTTSQSVIELSLMVRDQIKEIRDVEIFIFNHTQILQK